jgi:hypothetical protein
VSLKDQVANALRFKAGGNAYLQPKDEYIFAPDDDQFLICDPDDVTKCVRLDAGNVTTATTRVFSFPDASITGAGAAGTRASVYNTGGVYATPVVLTEADSNKLILLNDAAGLDFTLPAITASNLGITYRFRLLTTLSSNNYRMTAQSGDLLFGHVVIYDKDAATGDTNALFSLFRPNGSSHLVVTIGGSADTSGRLTGGWIDFEALTATAWFVRGSLIGDGSLVTVFS